MGGGWVSRVKLTGRSGGPSSSSLSACGGGGGRGSGLCAWGGDENWWSVMTRITKMEATNLGFKSHFRGVS